MTIPWLTFLGLVPLVGAGVMCLPIKQIARGVGMIFALQIRRTMRELILAGLFSALIAFLLFLIWDFDAPYTRGITASASPFLNLFPHIQS